MRRTPCETLPVRAVKLPISDADESDSASCVLACLHLDAPSIHLALFANVERLAAIRAVPLGRARRDGGQADALEMKPFNGAVLG